MDDEKSEINKINSNPMSLQDLTPKKRGRPKKCIISENTGKIEKKSNHTQSQQLQKKKYLITKNNKKNKSLKTNNIKSENKSGKSPGTEPIPEKMPFWQGRQYPVAEKARLSALILNSVVNDAMSARQACMKHNVPQTTFLGWVDEDKELAENYARARDLRHDKLADEIIEVSKQTPSLLPSGGLDSVSVQKHKLIVDSLKWTLSKLAPRKYGDRIEITGDKENPLQINNTVTLDVKKLSSETLREIMESQKHDPE